MKSISELTAKYIAEIEEYLANLDQEYDRSRAEGVRLLGELRGQSVSLPLGDSVRPATRAQNLVVVTPAQAVQLTAVALQSDFTFSELLTEIQRRYPTSRFAKEAVRAAFRFYVKKENCPIFKVPNPVPGSVSRYRARPEAGFFDRSDLNTLPVNSNGRKAGEDARA